MLQKEDCLYQPFYCEENIWQLCKHEYFNNTPAQVFFLLPSSETCLAVWNQRLAKPGEPILWDYHTILYDKNAKLIFDFDSTLNFPQEVLSYFQHTFSFMYPSYLPTFRIVPKNDFVHNFYSDRSHMKNDVGQWIEQPPAWEIPGKDIAMHKKRISLTQLLDTYHNNIGKTYSFAEMLAYIKH